MELTIRTKTSSAGNVYHRLAAALLQVAGWGRAMVKTAPGAETSSEKDQTFRVWMRWLSEQETLRSNGFGGAW
jgi:hypothetical protein